VSHLKERKEKNCLNCQSEIVGRYCHSCGQENLEPKETVWHLVQHFFNDITHFDGKFFETVKYLLRRPGFLSLEYMKGRRMSYLNPIRMYVFTSAIFFIILFSLKKPEDIAKGSGLSKKQETHLRGIPQLLADQDKQRKKLAKELDEGDREEQCIAIQNDSIQIVSIRKIYGDSTRQTFSDEELKGMLLRAYNDSLAKAGVSDATRKRIAGILDDNDGSNNTVNFGFGQTNAKTVEGYDSSERALPDSLRDGWFKRTMMRRSILINQEWHEDRRLFMEHLVENIFHSFPKILFISLPIFALILNMLYFRHKQYYYVDHGIFTIHVYCATFILLLGAILVQSLKEVVEWQWLRIILDIAIFALYVYMMIYLYKAMRGFYRQRRAKTLVKYVISFSIMSFINLILLCIFLLISVFSV
jgi:uncharacterized protein DUF3667